MAEKFKKTCLILLLFSAINARIHKLKVENDLRSKIDLTTFGFVKGGQLVINITNFHFEFEDRANTKVKAPTNHSFGFSLGKTSNDNLQNQKETCDEFKDEEKKDPDHEQDKSVAILFTMDLTSEQPCLHVTRVGEDLQALNISISSEQGTSPEQRRHRRSLEFLSDSYLFPHVIRHKRADDEEKASVTSGSGSEIIETSTPLDLGPDVTTTTHLQATTTTVTVNQSGPVVNETKASAKPPPRSNLVTGTIPLKRDKNTGRYSTHFWVNIRTDQEEGLYNLFFHNCDNSEKERTSAHKRVNFTVHLIESNYDGKNYLSAGEIPLPTLYMTLCAVYFVLAGLWWAVIRKAIDGVFKTHYMMLVFLFVKCISLFFHSINFHFIQTTGHHEAAFAILYYITYLMKGTMLFVTIVLVGAGWAFVKHILSKRDKKIFIIVIPLQILANVAQIIIEETEEGQSQYLVWKQLFIMLDLLCCGAILFPVIWSIRHLQDGSQTDGKAAINLSKLKIFRHFYIMIVCYIYFTRIIVYLLAMTLPFQFTWMCTVFKEVAALVFFVVTGYKFRPASDNPYLQLPQSDDEVEMDQVLTESGVTEGLTRVNIKDPSNSTSKSTKQRESSHEYD